MTRDRIVEAAVAFADRHGLEQLSMRKLGADLGVEAMSLYNHVENKDDIYDGMIDYVFSLIPVPTDGRTWQESIRQTGVGAMGAFGSHSWVVLLLTQRGNFGPGALRFMNTILGRLLEAGFPPEDAHHAWQMLASHTVGYAFQQSTSPGSAKHEYADLEARMASLAPEYPNVAALSLFLAESDFRREYQFGLEIIIDGLEARLRRANES